MAFDRTDPTDVSALKSELTTDPIGMGYAAETNTQKILALLNDPSLNVGGDTVGADFTYDLLLTVIDPNELTAGGQTSTGEVEWIKMLMSGISDDIAQHETKFRAVIASGFSNTLASLNAQQKPISRAEVLFGVDTVLVKEDYYAARDNT